MLLLGQEAYMAESSTFYTAFGPAMDVLQHKGKLKAKGVVCLTHDGKILQLV